MVEQNLISKNHRIRKLQDGEVVQSFNCGDTELNDFILNKAADYKKSLLAVSYVLEDNGNPIAYFSLSNDNLSYENFVDKSSFNRLNRSINNAKRMRNYPAMKIGRFAIDLTQRKKGLGSSLLDIVKYSLRNDPQSGCRFITVDAYNDAIAFYQKNGFVMLNEFQKGRRTQPMFFDLAQLI
ncbi:MAG: GNAT family N-acetyltransferase [Paludibacteraceae bacterium]|nr:GNAT family N-acetyltransferase [Paludibacteraceae bacterium]